MYLLTQRWTEPCDGNESYVLDITKEEADRLCNVLDWLAENGGDNYGYSLPEWEVHEKRRIYGDADLVGIDDVLTMIALESRYKELENEPDFGPGCYYGNKRNPDLDGR